jgi:protein phosphatase 2C
VVIGEAFQAVNGEVVACGGAGATALVALVLERYIVVAK